MVTGGGTTLLFRGATSLTVSETLELARVYPSTTLTIQTPHTIFIVTVYCSEFASLFYAETLARCALQ